MVVSQRPPTSDVLVGALVYVWSLLKVYPKDTKQERHFPMDPHGYTMMGLVWCQQRSIFFLYREQCYTSQKNTDGFPKRPFATTPNVSWEHTPQKIFYAQKCLEKHLKFKRWNIPTTLMTNNTSTQDSDPINQSTNNKGEPRFWDVKRTFVKVIYGCFRK